MQMKLVGKTLVGGFFALSALILCGSPASAGPIFNFGTCGATGALGPTQALCDSAYASTNLASDVTVTGGIQNWATPSSGTYRITAIGAQGASSDPSYVGGLGALIAGDFTFAAGTSLQLAVGQMGTGQSGGSNGGGGGGSFIVDLSNSPLLIAGGGGGTRYAVFQNGCDASITAFGIIGSLGRHISSCAQKTTGLGLGGIVSGVSWGSGGGGFFGDGAADSSSTNSGDGGNSWANGLTGGQPSTCTFTGTISGFGGFGAGGSGDGCWGGGGGGGYSGGDGGRVAGGGGSWNTGANPLATAGVGIGHGSISIELLSSTVPVPEPNTLALLGLGLAGLGLSRLKKH